MLVVTVYSSSVYIPIGNNHSSKIRNTTSAWAPALVVEVASGT
jgi:hypothetical protein